MMRSRVSFFGLCLLLLTAPMFSSAQTLDDPTKVDPNKQQQGNPPTTKPDEKKPDEKKPDEKKPDEKKPEEKKPEDRGRGIDENARLINETDKKRSVGINSAVTERDQTMVVQAGPFAGLEVFGFKYFSAARESVLLRAKIKTDELQQKKEAPINALTTIVNPSQISFNDVSLPAPDRYQLGPGDKLIIRYSSPTEEVQDKASVIDSVGNLYVPVAGTKITVRGMTLNQVQAAVQKEIARFWKNPVVTVTLTELRTISVNIIGEVILPGNYQFPAVMTLFNAVMAAGGPTFMGSIRNIEVRRSNNKAISVDLYKFFLNGDSSQDFPLQPGDTVVVPWGTQRVAIKGSITRSMIYEIKPGERFSDLLKMANGPFEDAILDRVERSTVIPNLERQMVNVDYSKGENPVLLNGDLYTLYSLRPENRNIVSIEGAVEQPRAYQWTKGMRISTAIQAAKGLMRDAYLKRADLMRENPDKTVSLFPFNLDEAMRRNPDQDIELLKFDRIRIYSISEAEYLEARFVDISGAIRKPGRYPRMSTMRLSDLILQAGGLLPEASFEKIFIFRKNADGSEGPLLKVDGGKALFQNDGNVELQDRDVIQVFKKSEASYVEKKEVRVEGAVQKPGTFIRSENLTVKDAIELAGGFLPTAAVDTVYVFRKNPDGTEGPLIQVSGETLLKDGGSSLLVKDLDQIVVYKKDEVRYQPKKEFQILGFVLKPGPFPRSEGLTLKDALSLAGGLKPGASKKIVVSHARVSTGTPTETYNYEEVTAGKTSIPILDGDVISIPGDTDFQESPQLIEVKGRVRNPGVYAITRKGETVAEIIKRAGGLADDAWTQGSSFVRDPKLLINDATIRLSPRIIDIVAQIQAQQYARALAKSDIDKVRLLGSGVSSALAGAASIANPIAAAGLGGTQTSDVKANEKLLSRETVSAARQPVIDNLGGNLPIRLDLALKKANDPNNILVRNGDIITIPETPSTVGVAGAVFIPSNQIFVPGKTLNFYLEKCGNYTADADRSQVLVIRPSGTVTKANGYTKIELGDTIFVPTKVMVASLSDGQSAFENIVKQITNTGLLYAIFTSLLNR